MIYVPCMVICKPYMVHIYPCILYMQLYKIHIISHMFHMRAYIHIYNHIWTFAIYDAWIIRIWVYMHIWIIYDDVSLLQNYKLYTKIYETFFLEIWFCIKNFISTQILQRNWDLEVWKIFWIEFQFLYFIYMFKKCLIINYCDLYVTFF